MKQIVKLKESELKRMISESIKRALNEGQSDNNPIAKWVYWTFNYSDPEKWMGIFEGAPVKHFEKKFYDECGGDMNKFFVQLDSRNQQIFTDYVLNNY